MATTHYGITREEHGDDCAGIRATGAPTRVGHLPGPSGDARAMDAGADCYGQGAVVSARDKVIATMKAELSMVLQAIRDYQVNAATLTDRQVDAFDEFMRVMCEPAPRPDPTSIRTRSTS